MWKVVQFSVRTTNFATFAAADQKALFDERLMTLLVRDSSAHYDCNSCFTKVILQF